MYKTFLLFLFFWTSYIVANENFVLITMLYNEKNSARRQEYITCMEKNLTHPLIDTIHVLYDTTDDDEESELLNYLQKKDVVIDFIEERVSYGQCFNLANELYPNRNIIVTNADIYFNETLYALKDYDLTNTFLALTRWNVQKNGSLVPYKTEKKMGHVYVKKWSVRRKRWVKRRRRRMIGPCEITASQDTWIFKTPIRNISCSYVKIGTVACDNKIAYLAQKAGLNVINPCRTIRCCHLHLSAIRHYERISQPKNAVLWVPWCKLPKQ